MKTIDIAEYSYQSLRKRKLRSWLTILGIVIGVASIVTLISLANGMNAQISSRLNALGDNVIQITPGNTQAMKQGSFTFPGLGGGGPPAGGTGSRQFGEFTRGGAGKLSFDDARSLARVDGVSKVDTRISGRVSVNIGGKETSVNVIGVDPVAFNELNTVPLVSGRTLNQNDKYTAVVGYSVYSRFFEGQDLLNKQLRVANDTYSLKVVGLLNSSSGSMVVSDDAIYVPVSVAKTILDSDNPSQFFVLVRDGYDTDSVAAAVEEQLLTLHRVTADKPDFTITTASFIESTVTDVTNTLALFLGGIAAISLIVGGIGVANTMFMSVLERIKEIGVLKAIGMKDGEVLKLFIFESAAIGIVGGVLGIVLSFSLSYILVLAGIPSLITLDLIALGLFFSAVVGVVSGVVPARNASKLQPVQALAYE